MTVALPERTERATLRLFRRPERSSAVENSQARTADLAGARPAEDSERRVDPRLDRLDRLDCTVDACDPVRGCVSTPPAGAEGLACRLGQLAAPDVCGPGEVDARTGAVIAKRVAKALELLAKTSQTTGDRNALLRKLGRQLGALCSALSPGCTPARA